MLNWREKLTALAKRLAWTEADVTRRLAEAYAPDGSATLRSGLAERRYREWLAMTPVPVLAQWLDLRTRYFGAKNKE